MPFLLPLAPVLAEGAAAVVGAALPTAALGGVALEGPLLASGAFFSSTASMASFPLMSAITTGGQLLSGISSRLSTASEADARAKALAAQARAAEQQKLSQGIEVTAKGHAIAAASGVEASSGSPLTQMLANLDTAVKNATIARQTGMLESDAASAEARAARRSIPSGIFDALASKSGQSLLSSWVP